jgi:hypothetical protein
LPSFHWRSKRICGYRSTEVAATSVSPVTHDAILVLRVIKYTMDGIAHQTSSGNNTANPTVEALSRSVSETTT